MSGHSKWSTIKRQKGVKDAARGALFTKMGNLIAIAARGGTDPETNYTLRLAVDKAKSFNMPMINIQRAIDRVKDKNSAQLQEVTYEGYGPGGVAVLVECATDNINRTLPEVKLAFSKSGGSLAEKGSVAYQFSRKGQIMVDGQGEELLLKILDAGAEDAVEEEDETIVYTAPSDLAKVRNNLETADIKVTAADLTFVPNTIIEIADAETARKLMNLMERLDDLEDVTNTYTNFEILES